MSTERGDVSAASLQKALEGTDYPANKRRLMNAARDNNAPDSIIEVVQKLPDKEFNSPTDVSRAFGEIQ